MGQRSASKNLVEKPHLSYQDAKKLASDSDAAIRSTLAARTDIPAEILYFLSNDDDPGVRRVAARNAALPAKADHNMVDDPDPEVRSDLAQKIAKEDRSNTNDARMDLLRRLTKDEITRVRSVVSEALKDVADVPSDIIHALAGDKEIDVAGPVLQHSPLLDDEHLLQIISANPIAGAMSAVAQRQGLSQNLSGTIAESDDYQAIAKLLGNTSAQIREETLDGLVDRAESQELWHAPLVGRPGLPGRAAKKLATFVADSLLEDLSARTDFDANVISSLRAVVHRRLKEGATVALPNNVAPFGKGAEPWTPTTGALPMDEVQKLYDHDKLTKRAISNALTSGDYGFVLAALILLSSEPEAAVRKIFTDHAGKAIVALVWKAKLPMRYAIMFQQRVAKISPIDVISDDVPSVFPLSDAEMEWQLKFYRDMIKDT